MVRAELNYNPYLLETEIRFNGKPPRINSLVEKHKENILQSWVSKIPSIFYDEMNGYDFELEFSGTIADCEDVKNAFIKAGVDESQVKIFHKNELDCRYSKVQLIEKLLNWFDNNKNRKFDYSLFLEENEEKLHNYCNCIIINSFTDIDIVCEEYSVVMECIEDVRELKEVELYHTPMIVCLDKESLKKLNNNLQYLLSRKDIEQEALFFMIHPELNLEVVKRTIKDLGVVAPKLISSVDDVLIRKYLEIYPVTDYIYNIIKVLRTIEIKIEKQVNEENETSKITNKEIYEHIDTLEDILKRLKMSAEKFANRDNIGLFVDMLEAKKQLIGDIVGWRNKKIKITKESEAINASLEFDEALNKFYEAFVQQISDIVTNVKEAIETEYEAWYQQAEFDVSYVPDMYEMEKVEVEVLPKISDEVLRFKEERYVMPKEDLFNRFFKPAEDKVLEPVLEVTHYYQKWRDYAVCVVEPVADTVIRDYKEMLNGYIAELAKRYQDHLCELIKEQSDIKEKVSMQLSDEEFKLQKDNDWLIEFQDQLKIIERG